MHIARLLSRLATVLASAALLAACASGPPRPTVDYKPDYDFSAVKKIAFYAGSGQVDGENPLQLSDMQRGRIDSALQYALETSGYQFVDKADAADLLVSWHVFTQAKTDVQTYNTPAPGAYGGYYGAYYGRYNRYSGYNCWSCAPMSTEVFVDNYTEGTFIVDLIDPELRKSVWRGVMKSRLKEEPSREQADYNEAATVMFESFPPGSEEAE